MYTFLLGFTLTYLILITIAAWRISHDFATQEGPAGIYRLVRVTIQRWVEEQIDNSPVERPTDHPLYWLYVGITCPRCISFTVTAGILLIATNPLTWPLALWWGIAGLITLLDHLLSRP